MRRAALFFAAWLACQSLVSADQIDDAMNTLGSPHQAIKLRAAVQFKDMGPKAARAVPAILSALATSKSVALRVKLIEALGAIKSIEAVEDLRYESHSKIKSINQAAEQAIKNIAPTKEDDLWIENRRKFVMVDRKIMRLPEFSDGAIKVGVILNPHIGAIGSMIGAVVNEVVGPMDMIVTARSVGEPPKVLMHVWGISTKNRAQGVACPEMQLAIIGTTKGPYGTILFAVPREQAMAGISRKDFGQVIKTGLLDKGD